MTVTATTRQVLEFDGVLLVVPSMIATMYIVEPIVQARHSWELRGNLYSGGSVWLGSWDANLDFSETSDAARACRERYELIKAAMATGQ